MRSNQKGFTLIELLAVIVILAIIALVTTPIVLNVIADARDKAALDKMYGVIDAVRLAYTQNQVSDSPVTSATITVTFAANTDSKIGNTTISISGDKPTAGTVTINTSTGKITATGVKFQNDTHTCSVGNDGKASC